MSKAGNPRMTCFRQIAGRMSGTRSWWSHPATMLPAGGSASYSLTDISEYPEEKVRAMADGHWIVAILVYVKYLDSQKAHETWTCFVYDHRAKRVYMHPQYGHMD